MAFRGEYRTVEVPAGELRQGQLVWLGGDLAIVNEVSSFMGGYEVTFRRPGSGSYAVFRVRGRVRAFHPVA